MAFAQRIINSNSAGDQEFTFTFPFIKEEHIKVFVNFVERNQGVGSSEFQVITDTTPNKIRLNTGLSADNTRVEIRRVSSINTVLVDFEDGSTLTAADLDTNSKQSLFIAQELDDAQKQGLSIDTTTGVPTLNSQRLSGVSDPINAQDAVTKNFLERTGSITSTQILDGTIVDADINASANINGSKLLNDSVGLTKLGSGALPTDITVASANIVNGTIVNDDIATGTLDGRYYTETELDAGQLDNRYYTETELNAGQLDNRYYTEAEADARFYNLASAEEIQSGETWTAADNKVATTAAIDARIIDLVDDVGGFVPIANETSFPNANPDVNNGAGTLVSVPLANSLTSNSSGVISIPNGTVGNSTVTITGATASSTFAQGFGIIVETTSTLNTYKFHRYVPKATEVTTVATNITNVNTTATNIGNVNNVGGNIANVNAVAGNATNINSAVSNASNINTVAGSISNVNDVGSNISNVIAVSNNESNINIVAGNNSNVSTVAGINGNVTTVAGISGNVTTTANNIGIINTVAGSITNVNNVGNDITNVGQVAASLSNVNTVASDIANVNTVAGNNSNINTVAGNNTNITTVANNNSNITAVAQDATDIGNVAGSIANVNTTAANIANVNAVGLNISNVNTVATNLTPINTAATYLNDFQALYLGAASSPPVQDSVGNPVNEGDLYFNSGNKQLQVYNGNVYTSIFDTALDFAKLATAAFNALYTASAGSNSIDLGGLAITGAAFSNEAVATNRVSLTKGSGTFNLGGI